MEDDIRKVARKDAVTSLNVASDVPKPKFETLFKDVYDKNTWIQQEQEDELLAHVERYPEHYQYVRR